MITATDGPLPDPFLVFLCFVFLLVVPMGLLPIAGRFFFYRNLVRTKGKLKLLATMGTWGKWKQCFYRDHPGARLCAAKIKYVQNGIMLRDIFSSLQFIIPPRYFTSYLPWNSLSNEKAVSLGWYLDFFHNEKWVEIDVDDCKFSLVIRKEEMELNQNPSARPDNYSNQGDEASMVRR